MRRTLNQGFTLIEIMVVLVVVGIGAGLISLSMGESTRPYETKTIARELYGSMNIALENAVFLNQQIGLRFEIDNESEETFYRYQWLYFDREKKSWLLINNEEFANDKELPAYIHLELEVDGQAVNLGGNAREYQILQSVKIEDEDSEDDKDKKAPLLNPDIYFLSSGEMQRFSLKVADKEAAENHYEISGDELGQLMFKRPDEKE